MKRFLLLLLIAAIVSCNNEEKNKTITADSIDNSTSAGTIILPPDSVLQGCYSYLKGGDTASLQLGIDSGNITGSLSYNLEGKDRNDGTFQGEIRGDRLEVWYLFRSEGLMSVRQEIFRIGQERLYPAFGSITVRNDSAFFSDPSRVSFDTTRAFIKVQCTI